MSEFLAGLTWADVERERLAPLSRARKESFGARGHKAMLVAHELRVQQFAISRRGVQVMPDPTPPRPRYRRKSRKPVRPVQQFTAAQIEAALQAMNNRKAAI